MTNTPKTSFDKSAVMTRAWEMFRKTYSYPAVPFKSIGRKCFAGCLRNAYQEARQLAAVRAVPNSEINARIGVLKKSIRELDLLPLTVSIQRVKKGIYGEISHLKHGLTNEVAA